MIRDRLHGAAPFTCIAVTAATIFGAGTTNARANSRPQHDPLPNALLSERTHIRVGGSNAPCSTAKTRQAAEMCSLLRPFSQTAGTLAIVVVPKDSNWFFYRRQGITVEVAPDSHWWCLWLCTTTTTVDRITATAYMSGASTAVAQGSCTSCGSLDVMGPAYWGFNVPRAYDRVSWSGTITVHGMTYGFSGAALY